MVQSKEVLVIVIVAWERQTQLTEQRVAGSADDAATVTPKLI